MKSLFTVASFTIKEMVKKKSFIVSNIIFLIIILVGTNIPRIINNFNNGDGSLTKLLIVDENNKFNGSLDSLKENDIGYDIGSNSIKIFNKALETAKRVIFNGPVGLFEDNKYAKGTRMLFKCLDKNKVKTIIGGGDSAAAVNKLGFSDSFYHVSTGGGATMKYLESRSLVGIDVIEDKKVN